MISCHISVYKVVLCDVFSVVLAKNYTMVKPTLKEIGRYMYQYEEKVKRFSQVAWVTEGL